MVISRVISPLIGVISIVTLLITPLKTTHEPPSTTPWKSEQRLPKAPTKAVAHQGGQIQQSLESCLQPAENAQYRALSNCNMACGYMAVLYRCSIIILIVIIIVRKILTISMIIIVFVIIIMTRISIITLVRNNEKII